MRARTQLPDDPALPGLAAVRELGLHRVLPELGLEDEPEVMRLCGYRKTDEASRATLEVRAGDRHFAVKLYSEDPAPEAELYRAFAAAGLARGPGARVPPLLAYSPEPMALAIGWLDGPTAHELIKEGDGERAGVLAASWLRRVAQLNIGLGPAVSTPRLLDAGIELIRWEGVHLGATAGALAGTLERTRPALGRPFLVHGTFYDRSIIDLGDGAGVIDWQRFGQGPLELDAGMFLATVTRERLLRKRRVEDALSAEVAFLRETAGLLDPRAVAWHRAAALLRLAILALKRHPERVAALLNEAARFVWAAVPQPLELRRANVLRLFKGWTHELVLNALSDSRTSREELAQIRQLLGQERKRPVRSGSKKKKKKKA